MDLRPYCCWQYNALGMLREVGPPSAVAAQDASDQSRQAQTHGKQAWKHSCEVWKALQGFGDGISLSDFHRIRGLIQEKRARTALSELKHVEEVSGTVRESVETLTTTLQTAVDSLPDHVKETLEEDYEENNPSHGKRSARSTQDHQTHQTRGMTGTNEAEDDIDDDIEMEELDEIDEDAPLILTDLLDEAESNNGSPQQVARGLDEDTAAMENMRLFSVRDQASPVLERTCQKERLVVKILKEIRLVASNVVRIIQAILRGTCCEKVKAVAKGIRDLFRCCQLGKLLQRAVETVRKILGGLKKFWSKIERVFSRWMEEFQAAKRLGKFVASKTKAAVAPATKKIGKAAKKVVGKIFGRAKGE